MHGSPHAIQVSKCLTVALPGTTLIPEKKGWQAASLNTTKHPYIIAMLMQILVTVPVQSRIPSRKAHSLQKARTDEKTGLSPQTGTWSDHLTSQLGLAATEKSSC